MYIYDLWRRNYPLLGDSYQMIPYHERLVMNTIFFMIPLMFVQLSSI